jgi:hypothetical protein
MAKKSLLVAVLALIIAGGVFAQEEPWGGKKNLVSADLGLLVAGVRYERILTPQFSVGGLFYWANSFIYWNELSFSAFGRFYFWQGFNVELGLGFNIHSLGVIGAELDKLIGFGITSGLSYKFDPGDPGGFFIEPGFLLPITIGEREVWWWGGYEKKPGVAVGFVMYCGLGWAF